MALQPLFRLGKAPQTGGYRSLLAFWCGGAAQGEAVVVEPPTTDPGDRIVGGTFSRKRWHDLKSAWAAQRAAELKAKSETRKRKRDALRRAAKAAAEALELVETETRKVLALERALEGAVAAKNLADAVTQANRAVALARAIVEEEEEEEAIMLLLLSE